MLTANSPKDAKDKIFKVETHSESIHLSHHNIAYTLQHDYKMEKELAEEIGDKAHQLCGSLVVKNDAGLDEKIMTAALQPKHRIFYLGTEPSKKIKSIVFKFHNIHIHQNQIASLLSQFQGKVTTDYKDPNPHYEQIDFSNCLFNDVDALERLVSQIISDKQLGKRLTVINFANALNILPRDKARHQLIRLMRAHPHIELLGSEADLTQNPSVRFLLAGKAIPSVAAAKKYYLETIYPQTKYIERQMHIKDERFISDLQVFSQLLATVPQALTNHIDNLNQVLKADPCHLVESDKHLLTFYKNDLIASRKWVDSQLSMTKEMIATESRKPAITAQQKAAFLADQVQTKTTPLTASTYSSILTFTSTLTSGAALITSPPMDSKRLTGSPALSAAAASLSARMNSRIAGAQTQSTNTVGRTPPQSPIKNFSTLMLRKGLRKSTSSSTLTKTDLKAQTMHPPGSATSSPDIMRKTLTHSPASAAQPKMNLLPPLNLGDTKSGGSTTSSSENSASAGSLSRPGTSSSRSLLSMGRDRTTLFSQPVSARDSLSTHGHANQQPCSAGIFGVTRRNTNTAAAEHPTPKLTLKPHKAR